MMTDHASGAHFPFHEAPAASRRDMTVTELPLPAQTGPRGSTSRSGLTSASAPRDALLLQARRSHARSRRLAKAVSPAARQRMLRLLARLQVGPQQTPWLSLARRWSRPRRRRRCCRVAAAAALMTIRRLLSKEVNKLRTAGPGWGLSWPILACQLGDGTVAAPDLAATMSLYGTIAFDGRDHAGRSSRVKARLLFYVTPLLVRWWRAAADRRQGMPLRGRRGQRSGHFEARKWTSVHRHGVHGRSSRSSIRAVASCDRRSWS